MVGLTESTLGKPSSRHYYICYAKLSLRILQTHLTSEGGQIPGESDGLINGNAEAVGASVIGAV